MVDFSARRHDQTEEYTPRSWRCLTNQFAMSDGSRTWRGTLPRQASAPGSADDMECRRPPAERRACRFSLQAESPLYQEAAQRWSDYGFVLEEAQAHFGLARCFMALGDRETATEPLQKARAIFTRLQARPLINEVDSHLEGVVAL